MKITHNKVGTNLNTSDLGKADGLSKTKDKDAKSASAVSLFDTESAAKVEMSPRAQDMKKIKEAALAAPDVDEAKVARLQKMIDEGKYKVDAKAISDKMIDEQLNWE